jgi:hypothetical protein
MTLNSTIERLNFISSQCNRYLSVFLLLIGTIGNILNFWVFSQRKLRHNPCAIYFRVASLYNIISIISGLPPRMFRDWNLFSDLTETTSFLCTIRLVVLFTTRTIVSWLLTCATIDRYLASSNELRLRQWSDVKYVLRCIVITSIISLLFWSECFYCFDANLLGTPIKCYAKSDTCRIINDLSQAFITTILPSSVMFIFGWGTIRHVHRFTLVYPISPGQNAAVVMKKRKTETNLTRMLIVQIILLTIFNMPQAVKKLYLTRTFYQIKSGDQQALENLLFTIALLCTYVQNCLTFFLFTFTGTIFRKTILTLFQRNFQR